MDQRDEFERSGFLSTAIKAAIPQIRAESQAWFDLAFDVNKALQESATRATALVRGTSMDPKVQATLITMRAAGNFQGALILIERGMVVEARTLVRSCIEASFCLAALHDNPDKFFELLKADDDASRKAQAKFILENEMIGANEDDRRARLKAVVISIPRARNLPLVDVAGLGEYNRQYLYYRVLSHDSAHISARSIHRHMVVKDGAWIGFRWGPESNSAIVETLNLGVLMILGLGVAFTQIVDDAIGNAAFAQLSERHKEMWTSAVLES